MLDYALVFCYTLPNYFFERLNNMPRNRKSGRGDFAKALAFFSQVGIAIIACVAIGVFLGRWLDGLLDTSPWLLLVFSFLGMGAAFKSIIDLGNKK